MLFLRQACAAIVLVMLTLGMQSAGMAGLIEWAKSHFARGAQALGPWGSAVLVVRFTSLIICLHVLEILLWTAFYRWRCLSTWESAFYFSATSYSTVGYGDVVLQPVWRLLGPVESVSGVLMCGLSASFLFAVVARLIESSANQPRAIGVRRRRTVSSLDSPEPEERSAGDDSSRKPPGKATSASAATCGVGSSK